MVAIDIRSTRLKYFFLLDNELILSMAHRMYSFETFNNFLKFKKVLGVFNVNFLKLFESIGIFN